MRYQRGGRAIKTGKLGRVNILRQQVLLPGEYMAPSVSGTVRLTPMRERETIHLHARVDAFYQPVRWLWPGITDWLKAGPSNVPWPTTSARDPHRFGVGGVGDSTILQVFVSAPERIYNEWYKWPEAADITSWGPDGPPAVTLERAWTRLHESQASTFNPLAMVPSATNMDIRDLAEIQAKYRHAVQDEWLTHDRYIALLKEVWHARGDREVDQVPVRMEGAEAGVDPRNLYASDAAGLGATAAIYNFGVDHRFGRVAAPEHMVVTYMMLVRLEPVAEDEISPTATVHDRTWAEMAGHAGMLAAMRPQSVRERNYAANGGSSVRGELPAGWEWRTGFNVVDERVGTRGSFPFTGSLVSQTATTLRDASHVGQPFVSQSLGDYFCDLRFNENVESQIPGPRASLFLGEGDSGRSAYPYPGTGQVV